MSLRMHEKNRLNDVLYQISVDSKGISHKLKAQEKTIQNNLAMHQELLAKKETYVSGINFAEK